MKHTNLKKTLLIPVAAFTVAATLLLTSCSSANDSELKNSLAALSEKTDSAIAAINEKTTALEALIKGIKAEETAQPVSYAEECVELIQYIDANISDRDLLYGEDFKFCQTWITWELMKAGYNESDIVKQNVPISLYLTSEYYEQATAVESKTTDGKTYVRVDWRNYEEDENGEYVYATFESPNLILTCPGKTDKQIIIGAHYDGDGTGDNGSGIALALETAKKLYGVETEYTIKFIFYTGEEYGLFGSNYYAKNMTEEEIASTLYVINLDSLICGDYCYLYGGVQDDETKTVSATGAFDNAMKVAEELGISFKSNPWTYENPAPGYDSPDYASPSTGDWSDHVGFKKAGIEYLYFEATNWDIPGPYAEYDGYGETYLIGMLMNTENDYWDYIVKYFPERPMEHMEKFSALMWALVTQDDYE